MIDERNYVKTALSVYDNPQCIRIEEFESDLARFSLIKKLITRYSEGNGNLSDRLVLNHLVICFNVFGDTALDFVLYKVDQKNWGILFPFLILLNRLPEYLPHHRVFTTDIQLDQRTVESLRKI